MRIAVLSDIHANLEALNSVVADMVCRNVDKTICLGDMVGYGPNPDEVLTLVRKHGYECILGNHEAGFVGKEYRDWLNFQAKENNIITEQLLSEENVEFCKALPKTLKISSVRFVHGFPPDSVLTYLKNCTDKKIKKGIAELAEHLCIVGHTHTLSMVYLDGQEVVQKKISCGVVPVETDKKYIINGGSVGQPRDGNGLAKYLIIDLAAHVIEVYCLEYDVEKTIQKIEERGFPGVYGMRLR